MIARYRRRNFIGDVLAVSCLCAFAAWQQWDVIARDHLPVGGDKATFSFGLLSYYGECLASGTLPFWNDRWGLGFPALAESQTGGFYPPHLLFYRLFSPIDAFRWNYLLHRFLVVLVGYASMRSLSLRPLGAWLAAFCYANGGFAISHVVHLWALESIVWLPAIVAATWRWHTIRSERCWKLLPLLIVLQLVIGHFQVAFMTMVSCAIISASFARRHLRQTVWWLAAALLGFGMAAPQLAPTFHLQRFVRQASTTAFDVDFLSTHAVPPLLLMQPFWPHVYFREPLWRPSFWTLFRTSPEECLHYVGLMPLGLALAAIPYWRCSHLVRSFVLLFAMSLLLSFGPYLELFDALKHLPGFGYFRCWARWILIQEFALAVLAGWMLDRFRQPCRFWSCWRRMIVAVLGTGLLTCGFFAVLHSNAKSYEAGGNSETSKLSIGEKVEQFGRIGALCIEMARKRDWDNATWVGWHILRRPFGPTNLISHWADIGVTELVPTLIVLCISTALLLPARLGWRCWRWWLCVGCIVDLGWFCHTWRDCTAPRDRLEPTAGLLTQLQKLPHASRVDMPAGNLGIAFGLSPIHGYRTMDISWPKAMERSFDAVKAQCFTSLITPDSQRVESTLFGLAATVERTSDLLQNDRQSIVDPDFFEPLDWWQTGGSILRQMQFQRGIPVEQVHLNPAQAKPHAIVAKATDFKPADAALVTTVCLHGLYDATPIRPVGSSRLLKSRSERHVWLAECSEPAVLVVGEMFAPGWRALIENGEACNPVDVIRVDDFWQGIPLPCAGKFTVRLEYDAPGFRAGCYLFCVFLSTYCAICWSSVSRKRQ